MKKIFMILAAASVVLAADSCNKENVSSVSGESMVVKFTAKVADTRAVFKPGSMESGAAVPVVWKGGEKLDIYVNEAVLKDRVPETPVSIPEGEELSATAAWSCDFSEIYDGTFSEGFKPEAPFTFYAFCPGELTRAFYNGNMSRILVDALPAEQTPEANSCDQSAMMICSVSESFETWPEEVEMPAFTHMTAYGCVSLGTGIPADETVQTLKITANEGQYLAGAAWYYYAGENKGTWENYSTSGTETISLTTSSRDYIWFGCRPTTDLTSLTFEVATAEGNSYKVVKELTGRNFESGKVALMTINGFGKVEEMTEVTYSWSASDLASLIGGNYTTDALNKSNSIDSKPSLSISTTATLAADVESVSVATASGRLKFGTGSNVMDDFSLTITPETGWMVKNVVVNAARAASCGKYSILAKVNETTLIDGTITTSNADYESVENASEGPLVVTVSKNEEETSGVFYLSNMSLTLMRVAAESDFEN